MKYFINNKSKYRKGMTFLFSLLFMLCTVTAFAQISIRGTVSDEAGATLPGVNVMVKGTITGTATDVNGNYTISVPNTNAVLVFSFVGYTTQEMMVGNQTAINIILSEAASELEEVVVIGYGTVRKSDLTGSVASVTEKQFQDQPITRLDQALNGRVPGVSIITNSGAPEQSILVRIRGANSIYGGNDPLYVVDGIPNSTLFNNLDANDIQSIEVLKDASATAIYGSRGANGVVLVTTRRGAEGKARISFESLNSWSTIAKTYDMLSAADFAESVNLAQGREVFTAAQISDFKTGKAGTDWRDLIFRTAYSQNHRLNISGGTPKLRYLVSANMMDTQGILVLSESKRYGIRSNITADATDWLKIDFDVNAFMRKTQKNGSRGGHGTVIADAHISSPAMNLKDENGNWLHDPISSILRNCYGRWVQDLDESTSNYVQGNLKLTFKLPVKGLTFDVQGSASYNSGASFSLTSTLNNLRASASESNASNTRNDNLTLYNVNQLNYSLQIGDHRLNAVAVAEFNKYTSGTMSASIRNLITEAVTYWNLNMGTMNSMSNQYSENSMASFIGRAAYSYKDRYLLTATFRRDGTSTFINNKWGNFPSVGVSWVASQEEFIRNLNVFDMLKVRATWGVTGNQAIGTYATLGLLSGANYDWGTGTQRTGYRVGDPPARDLTWEKSYQYDIGFDFGFFRNRLTVGIDLYQKDTKDLLLRKPIPFYDGGGNALVNLGEVQNRGVEVALNGIIIHSKDLSWESMVNFSYYKNKVVDLGGEKLLQFGTFNQSLEISPSAVQVGKPLGSLYGFTWLGLWRTDEAAEAAKWNQKPGDNKFKDFNGDYIEKAADDGSIIGKAFPDVTFGWNNLFTWKNLDVNVFIQGAFGADRLNLARFLLNEPTSEARWITGKEGWFDRWTEQNQNTRVPNPMSGSIHQHAVSTQYLESANYVRIKNISIGYTLPKSLIKVCDLKISLSAQNVFTFTNYTGLDPEGTFSYGDGRADINAGLDGFSYPLARTYTVGVRLNF